MTASLVSVGSSVSIAKSEDNINKDEQFLARYNAQCKRHNTKPLREIKLQSNHALSFIGDRINLTDWIPLLNAIKKDRTLHYISIRSRQSSRTVVLEHITTLSKAKELTRGSILCTKYLRMLLLEALAETISESRALRCLELRKIPIAEESIQSLGNALSKTKSLQHVVLNECGLGDQGCLQLTRALRNSPSVTSIDLSGNDLTAVGAEHVAALIKAQEVSRYNECWKHSLRYREVTYEVIPGLRRITLNNNPEVGDKGLRAIVEVLYDDYWIKALDMQNCGITDRGCTLIEDLIKLNKEIVIFDIRRNPIVDATSIAALVQVLARNANPMDKAQYGWIDIVSTPSGSSAGSVSSIGLNSINSTYTITDSRNKVKNYVEKNSAMFDQIARGCQSAGSIVLKEPPEPRPLPKSLMRTSSSSALTSQNPRRMSGTHRNDYGRGREDPVKKKLDPLMRKMKNAALVTDHLEKRPVVRKQLKEDVTPGRGHKGPLKASSQMSIKIEPNRQNKALETSSISSSGSSTQQKSVPWESPPRVIGELEPLIKSLPRKFTESLSLSSTSSDSDTLFGPNFTDGGNRSLKAIFKDYIKTQNRPRMLIGGVTKTRQITRVNTSESDLSTPSSFVLSPVEVDGSTAGVKGPTGVVPANV